MADTFPLLTPNGVAKTNVLVAEITQIAHELKNDNELDNHTLSAAYQSGRQRLIEATWQLHQHALGPKEFLTSLNVSIQWIACLKWLCRFKIFESVPMQGTIRYKTLALITSAPEGSLKSVARMAMTSGLFNEPSQGEIAHSETSAFLASDPNLLLRAEFMTEVGVPTANSFADATCRWPNSLKTTETAYNLAWNTKLPFFDHMKTIPNRTEQFAGYMNSVTNSEGTNLKHLVAGYDWKNLPRDSVIVDIGGSMGHSSIAVAQNYPGLRFVVQDLDINVKAGRAALEKLGRDADRNNLAERVLFQPYDFFHEQPIKDADLYLLRMIIHDWSDDDAVKILTRISDAMKFNQTNTSLVIMDTILPSPGYLPVTADRLVRLRDLAMRQTFNSRERDLYEWIDLMKRVNPAFRLVNQRTPPGSVLTVMEWKIVEDDVSIISPAKVEKDVAKSVDVEAPGG